MARLEPVTYSLAGFDYTEYTTRRPWNTCTTVVTVKKSMDTRFAMA